MRTVGRLTTVLVVAGIATGVVVGIRSIPDIKRYLEISRM